MKSNGKISLGEDFNKCYFFKKIQPEILEEGERKDPNAQTGKIPVAYIFTTPYFMGEKSSAEKQPCIMW